jgi:hypothetical protein
MCNGPFAKGTGYSYGCECIPNPMGCIQCIYFHFSQRWNNTPSCRPNLKSIQILIAENQQDWVINLEV